MRSSLKGAAIGLATGVALTGAVVWPLSEQAQDEAFINGATFGTQLAKAMIDHRNDPRMFAAASQTLCNKLKDNLLREPNRQIAARYFCESPIASP